MEMDMDPAHWLGLIAAKLSSVTPVGSAIMGVGVVIGVAGWIWLVYQNGRFGVVHGVLSFIIPIYALVFAFVALEHRQKSSWTAAFLGGAVVAGLGYMLVFAARDCEESPDCGIRRDYREKLESGGEGAQGGESSAFGPLLRECGLDA